MKNTLLCLAFSLTYTVSMGQTITALGKVSNSQGKPVAFAFITDKQTQRATYSDSSGVFRINTEQGSSLLISGAGYQDATVSVENKNDFNIVLTAGSTSGANESANAGKTNADVFFETHSQTIDNLAYINEKRTLEETHGSRYLFNDWQHGYVIDQNNTMLQDAHSLFNYDKIDGKLLLTHDKKAVIAVDNNQVKSFTLFDQNAQPHVFESVPAIDNAHYTELLSSGKNLKIYKATTTALEKANYVNNGLMTTGHNYDEYVDKNSYYVLKPGAAPQKLELSKKSLKKTFADQGDTLNKFMAEHSVKDINDDYLKALGDSLNK